MKKVINVYLLIFLSMGYVVKASAQSTIRERRAGLLSAISLIEDYEKRSKIVDTKSADAFKKLFVSDTTLIYNDLIGISEEKSLSVSEYARLQSENTKIPSIIIKNVKKESVDYDGKMWHVVCSFDKEISYYDTCEIRLSSALLYNCDYKIKASIVYDPLMNESRFENIEGILDATPISTGYRVFKLEDPRDNILQYDGIPLVFDDFDQMFFPQGIEENKFVFKDPDVLANLVEDNGHLVHMQYKARRWRISPHFNVSFNNYYDISTTSDKISSKTSGNEFGIDIGYTFPSQSHVKISINSGIIYANSTIDLFADSLTYRYNASDKADIDSDPYVRCYQYAGSEMFKIGYVSIPLDFDFDFGLGKYLSIYAQVGIKNYLKVSAALNSFTASSYVYGIYPQYQNLILDERWGYNNFGHHEYAKSDVTDASLPVKTYSLDAYGGLGIRFKPIMALPQLAFDLGLQYQSSLLGLWDGGSNGLSFDDKTTDSESVLSYTVANGDRVRMLSNGISDMKRKNLSFKLGLVYKF